LGVLGLFIIEKKKQHMKLYLNTSGQTFDFANLDLTHTHNPEKSVFIFDFDD